MNIIAINKNKLMGIKHLNKFYNCNEYYSN